MTVFTGVAGPRDADGLPTSSSGPTRPAASDPTIPSADPAYYLGVRGLDNSPTDIRHLSSVTATIHAADNSPLLTVSGLDEMCTVKGPDVWVEGNFTLEKRFHFIPAARLLVTLPVANDRLVLRRLDIAKCLDQLEKPPLLIESPRVLHVRGGKLLEHQIEVHSKEGKVQYTLSDGPKGLSVSSSGKLTWEVPKSATGTTEKAIVSIVESSGREQFHTFMILVH